MNVQVAEDIRYLLDDYEQLVPTILEIPSKDHPYQPDKDYIMLRIKRLLGVDE
jgi:V-type H+-transporting ATPase subunit F